MKVAGRETDKSPFAFHVLAKPIGPLCNINCEYCFYLQKEDLFSHAHSSQYQISDDVLKEFIRQYIHAQPEGTREVNFAWQGGEPALLGNSFYTKVLKYQKQYARRGMRMSNAIQTNGILIDEERAKFFRDHDFLVGISIDGPEELHNRYRKDKQGRGTFSAVMEGLENLKKVGAEFNTLTVVQNHNSLHPEEVYPFLKEIGSAYLQFIPIVEALPEGGLSSRTVSAEDWGCFMNSVFRQWAKHDIGRIFVQHFDLILGLHMGYPASICVHAPTCGRAVALEHNGNLYSCDHYVYPENELGNIAEKSLAEMLRSGFQENFGRNKKNTLPEKCRRCDYLRLCWGACPKDRHSETEGGMLNSLCQGYYAFYDFTRPYFRAMGEALKRQKPASSFRAYLPPPQDGLPGPNETCFCLSGKKFKQCCGR